MATAHSPLLSSSASLLALIRFDVAGMQIKALSDETGERLPHKTHVCMHPKSSQQVPITQHARRTPSTCSCTHMGGGIANANIYASSLVWCSGTVLRPNTCHAHSRTHHIQAGLCTPPIHKLSTYTHSPSPCTGILMGLPHIHDGDTGRWTKRLGSHCPPSAAPWSTVRTYRGDRPLPRPAATLFHHMQVGGLSLSLCQRRSSSGSPPRVMPSSSTATAAPLPSRLLSRNCVHMHGGQPAGSVHGSHPRRLHAHAAHRVPTARADRPPCRPHTGRRPFVNRFTSVADFIKALFPSSQMATWTSNKDLTPPEFH
jgi:hypothetical protein